MMHKRWQPRTGGCRSSGFKVLALCRLCCVLLLDGEGVLRCSVELGSWVCVIVVFCPAFLLSVHGTEWHEVTPKKWHEGAWNVLHSFFQLQAGPPSGNAQRTDAGIRMSTPQAPKSALSRRVRTAMSLRACRVLVTCCCCAGWRGHCQHPQGHGCCSG